jgi:hypothetical protein
VFVLDVDEDRLAHAPVVDPEQLSDQHQRVDAYWD